MTEPNAGAIVLPAALSLHHRTTLIQMGFVFGEGVLTAAKRELMLKPTAAERAQPMVEAWLPAGWRREMVPGSPIGVTWHFFDARNNHRVTLIIVPSLGTDLGTTGSHYLALHTRYTYAQDMNVTGAVSMQVMDRGTVIHTVTIPLKGDSGSDYTATIARAGQEACAWLDSRYPGWNDIFGYWDA
ncbi:hypothetical protein JNJ66_01030 [Candidatus Saccharibacteria bacterium]|nr:hypothetical protein [Candidatus Saccharibacteria bacterium]